MTTSLIDDYKRHNVDSLTSVRGMTRKQLWDAGINNIDASLFLRLVKVYWESGHARIDEARAAARARNHGLRVLEKIENLAQKSDRPNELRVILCGTLEGELEKVAAKHIKRPTPVNEASVAFGKDGRNRLIVRSDEGWLMDFINGLPGVAEGGLEAVYGGLKQHAMGEVKLVAPRKMVHIIVPLPVMAQLIQGDTEDIRVRALDGTWRTGEDIMAELLEGIGLATFVNARNEPVKQYRLQRYFSAAQKELAAAVQHVCQDPECHRPFNLLQADHLLAWSKGGETNIDNILMLCEYHNMKKRDGDVYYKDTEGRFWKRREFGPDLPCTNN